MKTKLLDARFLFGVLKETASDWMEDNALRLSAALSYYSTFSIAPLLVIAMGLAGYFFGADAVHGQLDEQLKGMIGSQAAQAVASMVRSASKPSSSLVATGIGVVTLLLGASGVFGQLKDALNTIWEVKAKPGLGLKAFIHDRLLTFGMVLVIGFLLLISLLMSTALSVLSKWLNGALPMPPWLLAGVGFVISFAIVTLLFALIFKVLPDATVGWRSVWIGAAVTALLFEIGKQLLALYLGRESTASSYGAAASVVLLLLWVYYASCILLFGAEFTQVWAKSTGCAIQPNQFAVPVTAEMRAQQGLDGGSVHAPEPRIVPVPVYTPPPAPQLPHSFAEVPGYLRESPGAALLAALGCGYAVGLLARVFQRHERTPMEEVAHGSRELAIAAVPLVASAARKIASKIPFPGLKVS